MDIIIPTVIVISISAIIIIYQTTRKKEVYIPEDELLKITDTDIMNQLLFLVHNELTKDMWVNGINMKGYKDRLSEKKGDYVYNKLKELHQTGEIHISSEFTPYVMEILKGYEITTKHDL